MNYAAPDYIKTLADYMDAQLEFVERSEWRAEIELEALLEKGEVTRVERILQRIKERLSR